MNDQTDAQLLRAYAEHRSEPAFAELVRRHVDLIHSAAVRMVCDAHLAQDVTQGVFLALAGNAAQLTDRPVLSGWLHRTAQNIAAQTVRTDVRRRVREQEAAAMNELLSAETDALWEHIAPQLDTALGELSEADRDVLLLRYFERKSASEMATTLGISDEAAQKRVNRAVERLREFFAKRGLTVGASGLVVVISANAVQAAPVGLALTISAAATLAGTNAAATAIKTIAMTTLQKTVVTATVAVLTVAGIYEARQVSTLQNKVQTLRQQQAPLNEQIEQFQVERTEASRQLASLRAENERLSRNTGELLRLRNEVAQLRTVQKDVVAVQKLATQSASGLTEWKPSQLMNVGRATPQEALQTYLWSSITTNLSELRNSLVGDESDPPTEDGLSEFANGSSNHLSVRGFAKVTLLSQTLISPTEVMLEVNAQFDESGQGVSGPLTLRKVGDDWKLVVSALYDATGKITQLKLGKIANPSAAR